MNAETARALLFAIGKAKETLAGDTPLTLDVLEGVVSAARDYRPGDEHPKPPASYVPPIIPREFPKLKARYDAGGITQEYVVVQSWDEEARFHSGGWYTRPLAELEALKAQGVREYERPDNFVTRQEED